VTKSTVRGSEGRSCHTEQPWAARRSTGARACTWDCWVAQGLLALAFGMAGAMKTFTPIAELATSLPWVLDVPAALVRFIDPQ
jgi:hypothetical protein